MSNGIVTSEPNLNGQAHSPVHKSKIPFSAHVAGTYRFGEITPHFVAEVENNDKWPLRCAHNVRSFNLKAPLLSDIYLRKNYVQVPMEAILPLNWDKVYTNPVTGDDVDPYEVNCVVNNFPQALMSFFTGVLATNDDLLNFDDQDDGTWPSALEAVIKLYIAGELFFSSGSLFAALGAPLQSLLECNYDLKFDQFFTWLSNVVKNVSPFRIVYKGETFNVDYRRYIPESERNSYHSSAAKISFSHFLDLIRDDFSWYLDFDETDFSNYIQDFTDYINDLPAEVFVFAQNVDGDYPEWPFNYKRLVAYQLSCAHFFSNDKIDYIYSAELYRQQVFDAYKSCFTLLGYSDYDDVFSYNGLDYRYDYLSGHLLSSLFNHGSGDCDSNAKFSSCCDILRLLFGYNRSLRHLDYFSGAKSQPLAVGDTTVPVSANKVNVIDISRGIQKQRFLNFVHLVGRKFEEYTSKINGKYVDFDWHNPISLAKGTSDVIYGSEIENNNINPEANGQPAQSTTGVLRGSANTTAFEMVFDRPSVVLGLTWFDIERYYVNAIERQNFHVDRFDMFNEFMQYVGDQPIYRCELTPRDSKNVYFGYALRHQEYKQRVNRCFGGFASGMLPGWEFVADQSADDILYDHISPDYIRSRPSELDPFFLSLTGFSRGTYWHFIIDNYNITEPIRPMVVTPQILG